jgi:hypothetical protein
MADRQCPFIGLMSQGIQVRTPSGMEEPFQN